MGRYLQRMESNSVYNLLGKCPILDIENGPFAAERSRGKIAKLESNLRKGGMSNKAKKFSLFCL